MNWRLELRQAPALRVELSGITPRALAPLCAGDIARLTVAHGNDDVALGELFRIAPLSDAQAALASGTARAAGGAAAGAANGDQVPVLELAGDLARFDAVGEALDGGVLAVTGSVGRRAGALMTAGRLRIGGDAGDQAGCEMAGGELHVSGDAGAFAGGIRPGSMEGMRGGLLVIGGNVGERAGDRMRRGLLLIHGNAGAAIGSRMVAGTIAVAGTVGLHPALMMRRGTLVLPAAGTGVAEALGPGFTPTGHDIGVFIALLARSLARHGGVFGALEVRRVQRFAGDAGVDGLGEVLVFG